jgi:hypothetical protein
MSGVFGREENKILTKNIVRCTVKKVRSEIVKPHNHHVCAPGQVVKAAGVQKSAKPRRRATWCGRAHFKLQTEYSWTRATTSTPQPKQKGFDQSITIAAKPPSLPVHACMLRAIKLTNSNFESPSSCLASQTFGGDCLQFACEVAVR